MHQDPVIYSLFLIFGGAAVLSTLMLWTRQSLLVAYMLLGGILGPWGLRLMADSSAVSQLGNIGILFLLFLLGLNLQPQNLLSMLKRTTWVTLLSSLIFALLGFLVAQWFSYGFKESLIIGAAMMFSSTIIGLKLLPTTVLHHQHTGEVMISVLLMQDLIAIVTLLLMNGAQTGTGLSATELVFILLGLPFLIVVAFLGVKWLWKLVERFDRIQEYIFLVSIAWCLAIAELATRLHLSSEIGAFIAGVSLATHPVSLFIAESLKPLRDFFLILFFFAIGASFNLQFFSAVIVPALILALLLLIFKPLVFGFLLHKGGESKKVSREVGFRLGQSSEFSLLITYVATTAASGHHLIGDLAAYFIQATTIITFIISSYLVVLCYKTPMALARPKKQEDDTLCA